MKSFCQILLLFVFMDSFCQSNSPKFEELVKDNSGWELIKEWSGNAKNKVLLLPVNSIRGRVNIEKIMVTTKSTMGAVIYNTGGIIVDNGWIRILGSGSDTLSREFYSWNNEIGIFKNDQNFGALFIADDVLGGFFVLNGGALGNDLGKVYYFAPDTLEFEPLDLTYSGFLDFCFNGDLDRFYIDFRFKNWQKRVSTISNDYVFSFYPYLWSEEGKNINDCSVNEVPIKEQVSLNLEFRKQFVTKN